MARGRGARGPRFSPVTAPPVTVPTYSPVAGLTPEIVDALNLRKEAVDATKNATDQYEADVADFKNTMATEAEQGIASLPNVVSPIPEIPTYRDSFGKVATGRGKQTVKAEKMPDGSIVLGGGLQVITPDGNLIDMGRPKAGMSPPIVRDPVPQNIPTPSVKPDTMFIEEAFVPTPDSNISLPLSEEMPLPTVDITNNIVDIPTAAEIEQALAAEMAGERTDNINRPFNQTTFDYLNSGMGNPDNLSIEELVEMIDIEPGDVQVPYNTEPKQSTPGNFYRGVFQGGTKTVGPTMGRGPGTGGQGPYNPPPVAPPVAPPSKPAPEMYKRPTSFESGAPTLVRAMSPRSFGTAPGFEPAPIPLPPTIDPPKRPTPKRPPRTFIDDQTPPGAKGGMYLGDSYLNKGLSQLPMNGQNDTLTTQVFQAGFRPRR